MAEIPAPPMPRATWFGRNWKWFVPAGCLTSIIVLLLFSGAMFFFVAGVMKGTDAYKVAFERAQKDQRVIAALGKPIKSGTLVSGSSHVEGPGGAANLSIPISGPKGKATIFVEARKSADVWLFDKMIVEIAATKERIDLNAGLPGLP